MTSNNPSEEVRRNVLAAVLNIYENRVYDPAYKNSLRPRLEADMSRLLQTSNFEQEIDEHLRSIGIFPTAFEHEQNRKVERKRQSNPSIQVLELMVKLEDERRAGGAERTSAEPGRSRASGYGIRGERTEPAGVLLEAWTGASDAGSVPEASGADAGSIWQ
jgi:hypothetical protein